MAVDPVTGYAIVEGGRAMLDMFGAKNASDASSDAAKIQSDAALEAAGMMRETARESLGLQRDIYNQGRADQQPWIQAGQGSVNRLAHLMGIGMDGGGGFTPLQAPATGGTTPGRPTRPFDYGRGEMPAPMARDYGTPAGAYRWPGQTFPANEDEKPPTPNNIRQRPGFFAPRRPQNGGMVAVQAPDGSVEYVSPEEVQMMVEAGGQVLS